MTTIVVGLGGCGASAAAVHWAAVEADRRGWSLEILRAMQYPSTTTGGIGGWYPGDLVTEELLADLDVFAGQELEDACRAVSVDFPGLQVSTHLVHEHPRAALTAASQSAGMVVAGARRRGVLVGALLGSTSMHLAAHARSPVAVVPGPAAPGATGVVVGYDGSAVAEQALAFAADEASAFDEELAIVHAWSPGAVFPAGFDTGRYLTRSGQQQTGQRRHLDGVVDALRRLRPGLVVRSELLVDGYASSGLVDAAVGSRLLVVGGRGHGAVRSMLLGSTSLNVLHTSHAPVVVVPDGAYATDRRASEATHQEFSSPVGVPAAASS